MEREKGDAEGCMLGVDDGAAVDEVDNACEAEGKDEIEPDSGVLLAFFRAEGGALAVIAPVTGVAEIDCLLTVSRNSAARSRITFCNRAWICS